MVRGRELSLRADCLARWMGVHYYWQRLTPDYWASLVVRWFYTFMWPFSSPKRAPGEWDDQLAEILRRLKALERENDDLHAAYRKLRASQAVRERVPANGEDPAPVAALLSPKDELRRKHLVKTHVVPTE